MLTFDETVTIYNTAYNENTGFDDYYRTEVRNCSWRSKIKAVSVNGGISYSRVFQIRILDGYSESEKEYAPPEKFVDPSAQYTLAPGTIVLKGTGPDVPVNADEISALLTGASESFRIMDYHDNRRVGLLHLYAEGK